MFVWFVVVWRREEEERREGLYTMSTYYLYLGSLDLMGGGQYDVKLKMSSGIQSRVVDQIGKGSWLAIEAAAGFWI